MFLKYSFCFMFQVVYFISADRLWDDTTASSRSVSFGVTYVSRRIKITVLKNFLTTFWRCVASGTDLFLFFMRLNFWLALAVTWCPLIGPNFDCSCFHSKDSEKSEFFKTSKRSKSKWCLNESDKMCDVFKSSDVQSLLRGKHVVVFGGSVMRGLYKDLVWLLNDNSLIPK